MKKVTPRNYLFKMLARREHSILEAREKMLKKYPEEGDAIETFIAEFLEKNWLSESRFCEAFVRDQILKKSGPQKIRQKLMKKGVEKELIHEKIEQGYRVSDQLDIILKLARSKYTALKNRGKDETDFELQQKILSFLIGRGFDFDMAKKVAKNTANE